MNDNKLKEHNFREMKHGANWTNLRGKIRKEFPNITESDLQYMARGENELIGRLHMKSGRTKSQIREWVRSTAKIL